MKKQELKNEYKLTYSELVDYLLDKYGPAQYDYFRNDTYRSRNSKNSRTSEGLFCHHIDEDKASNLSNPLKARFSPYDYQKADRLVYCNILEHLLLHMKIVQEPRNPKAKEYELHLGANGIIFICAKINDYFDGYEYKKESSKKAMDLIKNNFDDYIEILNILITKVKRNKPWYKDYINRDTLSQGFNGRRVEKVYNKL